MSSPATTIGQDATVGEAARLMDARSVKRLPVVDELGRLVGIVSRPDLPRVFLRSDELAIVVAVVSAHRRQHGTPVYRGGVSASGRVDLLVGLDGWPHAAAALQAALTCWATGCGGPRTKGPPVRGPQAADGDVAFHGHGGDEGGVVDAHLGMDVWLGPGSA